MALNRISSLHRLVFAYLLCNPLVYSGCTCGATSTPPDAGLDASGVEAGPINRADTAVMTRPKVDDDARVMLPSLTLADARVPTAPEVVASLNGQRWEQPCSNNFNGYCDTPRDELNNALIQRKITTLAGPAGVKYDITLRFRGVIEEKTYVDGMKDGLWHVDGVPAEDLYNVYELQISDPPQTFFLNSGTSSNGYCRAIDYTRTVRIAAGATVTMIADPVDGAQVDNHGDGTGSIVIPQIAPAPAAFDGQFIQMDVVSVKQVP